MKTYHLAAASSPAARVAQRHAHESGTLRFFEARYLATEDEAERRRKAERALAVLGTLSDEEAERMEETRRRLRETWR